LGKAYTYLRMEAAEGAPQFSNSIYKVLKVIHPECGISKVAMVVVNGFIVDVCRTLTQASLQIAQAKNTTTLTSSEMHEAVRRVCRGDLAEHAQGEGIKACTLYAAAEREEEGGIAMPTSSDGPPRSGLVFPVGRVHQLLVLSSRLHIDVSAAVYLAAVLEYLVAEVVELAGHNARIRNLVSIKPRHVQIAIAEDQELNALLGACTSLFQAQLPEVARNGSDMHVEHKT